MKKIILLISCMLLIMSLKAQDISYVYQISIENEYTGVLESPVRYGISQTDLVIEFYNADNGDLLLYYGEAWYADLDAMYFMPYLHHSWNMKLICTIKKPGHKLNGLKTELFFPLSYGGNSFEGQNGVIFHIPD